MKKRGKNQRLKEPTASEVAESVLRIIGCAADQVFTDHRGDVMPAEQIKLVQIYLTRAQELMHNKETIRELFESGVIGAFAQGPKPGDKVH